MASQHLPPRTTVLLIAALPVAVALAGTIHTSLTSPLASAGQLAIQQAAATFPTQRSSAHLPYFSFVRALRPRS